MQPMTPEQRAEVRFFVPPGQNPAAPELVAHVACGIRALEISGSDPAIVKLSRDAIAVVQRGLAAEQALAACRRVLAEAVALADDLPDDGLTAGDLRGLLAARGLDLRHDIEHAEALRHAEQTAGVG